MFLAQPVTGAPDVGIALSVGNILSLVHHVHGAKDDVVVERILSRNILSGNPPASSIL